MMIAIDWSKQQGLHAMLKAIQAIKFSNLQLKQLKYEIKHGTQVTLKLLPNVVVDSIDETFPHRLLLTNTQVLEIWKAFVNDS